MVNVFGRIVGVQKPEVRPDEMFEAGDFLVQGVIVAFVLKAMKGAKCIQRLEIEKLVIEHVAALHIFIRPVAGWRHIEQAAVVVFPCPEKESNLFQWAKHFFEKSIIPSLPPVFIARDDEPKVRIHPAGGAAVTYALRPRINIAGDFPVGTLVLGQRPQAQAESVNQFVVTAEQGGQSGDRTVASPDTGVILPALGCGDKSMGGLARMQEVDGGIVARCINLIVLLGFLSHFDR